jgi:hypothetical protein
MSIKIFGYICLGAFLLLTCIEVASAYTELDSELIELNECDDTDERDNDDTEDELESKINGLKNNLCLATLEGDINKVHTRNIEGLSGLFISPIHEPPEL